MLLGHGFASAAMGVSPEGAKVTAADSGCGCGCTDGCGAPTLSSRGFTSTTVVGMAAAEGGVTAADVGCGRGCSGIGGALLSCGFTSPAVVVAAPAGGKVTEVDGGGCSGIGSALISSRDFASTGVAAPAGIVGARAGVDAENVGVLATAARAFTLACGVVVPSGDAAGEAKCAEDGVAAATRATAAAAAASAPCVLAFEAGDDATYS